MNNCGVVVRSSQTNNETKRTYAVSNSVSGKVNYLVVICNSPSCTCPDYGKYKNRVPCKHIIFVLLYVLQVPETNEVIGKLFMEDEDVEAIFKKSPKEINPLYMQEMSKAKKRKKSDYLGIMKRNPSFDGQQTMILNHKLTRTAKCKGNGCGNVLTVGSLCIKVDGAIVIPFETEAAVVRPMYFWCNVRYPLEVKSSADVEDEEKTRVREALSVPVI